MADDLKERFMKLNPAELVQLITDAGTSTDFFPAGTATHTQRRVAVWEWCETNVPSAKLARLLDELQRAPDKPTVPAAPPPPSAMTLLRKLPPGHVLELGAAADGHQAGTLEPRTSCLRPTTSAAPPIWTHCWWCSNTGGCSDPSSSR